MSALSRALRRVSLHRHAWESHASYLLPALKPLSDLLDRKGSIFLDVSPTALVYKGEPVHSEPPREGNLCFRLHRDGVRSITFLSGLDLEELVAFAAAALPDGGGGEDCVTRLWKAELRFVRIGAVSGYRLDGEPTGDAVGEAAERARRSLEQFAGDISESEEENARGQGPLLGRDELAAFDPEAWSDLARRAAGTMLRVVHRGAAGRDLPALAAAFGKLLDEMLSRCETALVSSTLAALSALNEDLRKPLAAVLADSDRLSRALDLSSSRPGSLDAAIETWLSLLPVSTDLAVDLLQRRGGERNALLLAEAVATRFARSRGRIERLLRSGPEPAARALLGALGEIPAPARAAFAAVALEHPSVTVRVAAVPLVAGDAETSVALLGPLLEHGEAPVRMAAAAALCVSPAHDEVAKLFIAALETSGGRARERDELLGLHRALGRLGTDAGFEWLAGRLVGGRRKMFRKRSEGDQLLAVQGLVAEGSGRAAQLLDRAAFGSEQVRVAASARAGARVLAGAHVEARGEAA
jgi:hypothetical protein